MSDRTEPPFRADHVGSLLRPEPLLEARAQFASGRIPAEELRRVEQLGGFACHHAHFDKAYLISMENLRLSQVDMQKKWALYKYLKENYTHKAMDAYMAAVDKAKTPDVLDYAIDAATNLLQEFVIRRLTRNPPTYTLQNYTASAPTQP